MYFIWHKVILNKLQLFIFNQAPLYNKIKQFTFKLLQFNI